MKGLNSKFTLTHLHQKPSLGDLGLENKIMFFRGELWNFVFFMIFYHGLFP